MRRAWLFWVCMLCGCLVPCYTVSSAQAFTHSLLRAPGVLVQTLQAEWQHKQFIKTVVRERPQPAPRPAAEEKRRVALDRVRHRRQRRGAGEPAAGAGAGRQLLSHDTGSESGNSFTVSQVLDVTDAHQLLVRVRYSTRENVMPIFMLPHRATEVSGAEVSAGDRGLLDTFLVANNPCTMKNGVTSLCCISSLVQQYHISSEFRNIERWMCHSGVPHTAASIAIPPLQHIARQTDLAAVEASAYMGEGTAVRVVVFESGTDSRTVDLLLTREFTQQHALVGNTMAHGEVEVYRFFVGVTFSELQLTPSIHNTAALNVITLFRNTSSAQVLATVVTQDAPSAMGDVTSVLYHREVEVLGARVDAYFVRLGIDTLHASKLPAAFVGHARPESSVQVPSIRYTIGVQGEGVAEDAGKWERPCEQMRPDWLSLAGVQSTDALCEVARVDALGEPSASVLVPLGADLPFGDRYILYVQFDTESSRVTAQVPLVTDAAAARTLAVSAAAPGEPAARAHHLRALGGQGLAAHVVHDVPPWQVHDAQTGPDPARKVAVVLGYGDPTPGTALTGSLFAIEAPRNCVMNDMFVFHFFGSTERADIAAASTVLVQNVLRGVVFHVDAPDGVEARLQFEEAAVDAVCDGAQCVWEHVVQDGEAQPAVLADTELAFVYNASSASATAPHELDAWRCAGGAEGVCVGTPALDTEHAYVLLRNGVPGNSTLVQDSGTTQVDGQNNNASVTVVWVALVESC